MRRLGTLLRKIVFSFGLIYGVNIILNKVGIYIPINYITLGITTILGVPGLLSLFAILSIIWIGGIKWIC